MSEFTSYIEVAGAEVLVVVHGDYQPEESQTHDYPGCCASAEIGAVLAGYGKKGETVDLLPILDKLAIELLEERLIEHEATEYAAKRFNGRFHNIAGEERAIYMEEMANQRGIKI